MTTATALTDSIIKSLREEPEKWRIKNYHWEYYSERCLAHDSDGVRLVFSDNDILSTLFRWMFSRKRKYLIAHPMTELSHGDHDRLQEAMAECETWLGKKENIPLTRAARWETECRESAVSALKP